MINPEAIFPTMVAIHDLVAETKSEIGTEIEVKLGEIEYLIEITEKVRNIADMIEAQMQATAQLLGQVTNVG